MRSFLAIAKPDALGQKKHLSDRLGGLAGMAWAFAVLHESGMTPRAAGIYFTPPENLKKDKNGDPVDAGVFRHYLSGERKPIAGPRGKYGVDLVAAVGKEIYGKVANSWLDHPLLKIFARDVSPVLLSNLCAEEKIPLHIVPSLLTKDFSDLSGEGAPAMRRLSDFLFVCAFYRMAHDGGYPSTIAPLIRYLIPQVCKLDPVFNFIHAPFVKMLEDYYFKTDEQVVSAWPVEMPPCVDPEFSQHEFTDGACLLNGRGKAKDVCNKCLSGGGPTSFSDWDV